MPSWTSRLILCAWGTTGLTCRATERHIAAEPTPVAAPAPATKACSRLGGPTAYPLDDTAAPRVVENAIQTPSCGRVGITAGRVDPNRVYWTLNADPSAHPPITAANDEEFRHRVFFNTRASRQRGQLVVVIPGRPSKPSAYEQFATHAAELGFHAISLATYVGDDSNPDICHQHDWAASDGSPSQGQCNQMLRRLQAYGEPMPAPYDEALDQDARRWDGAEPRLVALLKYLHQSFPSQDWQQFLAPKGRVAWGKVVLVGHSNGTGVASLIARSHKLARLLMFNGPKDYLGNGIGLDAQPIRATGFTRLGDPGGTRPEDTFAFTHRFAHDDTRDDPQGPGVAPDQCGSQQSPTQQSRPMANWHAQKLAGVADPDCESAPYRNAHVLRGTVLRRSQSGEALNMHNALIGNQGVRWYRRAWTYMLTGG